MKIRFLCVRYTCDHGHGASQCTVETTLDDPHRLEDRRCPACGRAMEMCIDIASPITAE